VLLFKGAPRRGEDLNLACRQAGPSAFGFSL